MTTATCFPLIIHEKGITAPSWAGCLRTGSATRMSYDQPAWWRQLLCASGGASARSNSAAVSNTSPCYNPRSIRRASDFGLKGDLVPAEKGASRGGGRNLQNGVSALDSAVCVPDGNLGSPFIASSGSFSGAQAGLRRAAPMPTPAGVCERGAQRIDTLVTRLQRR